MLLFDDLHGRYKREGVENEGKEVIAWGNLQGSEGKRVERESEESGEGG